MTTADISATRTTRPLRHLHWYRDAIGNIAVVVPGAAAGIFVAVENGHRASAVVLVVFAILTAVIVVVLALRVRLVLDREGARSSWRRTIPRQDVRRAVMRAIYNGDGVTTNEHLFLIDATGRTALRMSDRWWGHDQLHTVARHFDVSLETQDQPVQLAELRRAAPKELLWRERHRVIAQSAVVCSAFLLCLAFAALTVAATH